MSKFIKEEAESISTHFFEAWKHDGISTRYKSRMIDNLRSNGAIEILQKRIEKHLQNSSLPKKYNVTSLVERRQLFDALRKEIDRNVDFEKVKQAIKDICYSKDSDFSKALKQDISDKLPSSIESIQKQSKSVGETTAHEPNDPRKAYAESDVQSILEEFLNVNPVKK